MNKLPSTNKAYISRSKILNAGRGVFARFDIKRGEIIESCPVIEISKFDSEHVNETSLVTYIFYLGKNKERLIIALGFGSIYNHARQPNAKYLEKYGERIIDFIAIKSIMKDEEITINYNQGSQTDMNQLWFEV